MPRFPRRKEPSVFDFADVPLAPPSGVPFRERLMAQGRQSENVRQQVIPSLSRFDRYDPVSVAPIS